MASKERQARWRASLRARGIDPRTKGDRGGRKAPKPSKFITGNFVAVDGEGFNEGDEIDYFIGDLLTRYVTREHYYSYLSASDGSEIYNSGGRLSTKQCLDFLLDITANDPDAILCIFAGGYDCGHMLYDLPRDNIRILLHGSELDEDLPEIFRPKNIDITLTDDAGNTHDYRLDYRPRKSLSIWRWEAGATKYQHHVNKKGETVWKSTATHKAILWDVWGFFQGSFKQAMQNWLPGDKDYEFISRMKGDRSEFNRSEIEEIKTYNKAELRCLVGMMEKLRGAIGALGLQVTRWDGSGAISGAMMKKHNIKQAMADCPEDVFDAARIAYSGGHIEAIKVGYAASLVHHADINSAYPYQFTNLPDLSQGEWINGTGTPPPGFTLVHVEYNFRGGMPFYPLFYRNDNGSIVYPRKGQGWHWYPEYAVAKRFNDLYPQHYPKSEFRVIAWKHFRPSTNTRPFDFITEYYEARKAIVQQSRETGIPNGVEHTIKLGINGVYGKCAQQIGARLDLKTREVTTAAYFQLEWAGYVTAGCRAQLMEAAIQKPYSIISFATDGIYSLEKLDLYAPKAKILGAWEYKEHIGMTMVMPGIYWLHDEPTEKNMTGLTHYSRGFKKSQMKEVDFVHQAWARKQTTIALETERMVTLGTALISDDFWAMRGQFPKSTRTLNLNGGNVKRYGLALHDKQLHRRMYDTMPTPARGPILGDDFGDIPLSAPYPLEWDGLAEIPDENTVQDVITEADKSFYFDQEESFLAR